MQINVRLLSQSRRIQAVQLAVVARQQLKKPKLHRPRRRRGGILTSLKSKKFNHTHKLYSNLIIKLITFQTLKARLCVRPFLP